MNCIDGILLVNKEKGMTSFDVIRKVRMILGIKKIGHTGTLDPLATGVLVLTLGKATKLGEILTSTTKEYIATAKLGMLTDTLDLEGKIIKEKAVKNINIKEAINNFPKKYLQEVPIYSAIKVKGKKLYEYARSNEKVELPKKEVTINSLKLLDYANDNFTIKCDVSKGTYIRSLIRDIAKSINNYATMTFLERIRQGDFTIDECFTLKDIEEGNYKILSIDKVLKNIPKIDLSDEMFFKVKNGVKLVNDFDVAARVLFTYKGSVVAIYKKDDNYLIMDKYLL